MPTPLTGLAAALAALAVGLPAADLPDLSKVDRSIKKEPAYVGQAAAVRAGGVRPEGRGPRLDGPRQEQARRRSLRRAPHRPRRRRRPDRRRASGSRSRGTTDRFHVDDFKDPATGVKHPRFTVRLSTDGRADGDAEPAAGAASSSSAAATRRTRRPATCGSPPSPPTRRSSGSTATRPFRFQRWYGGKLTGRRGRRLQGLPGSAGPRPSHLLRRPGALPARRRVREGDPDLPRRDGQGAAAGLRAEGAVLRDAAPRPGPGPERRAASGKAIIRVELPEGSKYKSIATDIAVELIEPKSGK